SHCTAIRNLGSALFNMRTAQYIAIFVLLALVCPIQVQTAPVPEDWTGIGLITRAKRSLLWRWNTLKPEKNVFFPDFYLLN
ncbi:unnamed protein product, partial [Coregonus sp. 'balchen']